MTAQNHSLFVAYDSHLEGLGGVQTCTKEFIAALRAAGLELDIVSVETDRRMSTRVLRSVNASPYFRPVSVRALATIQKRAQEARYVFINQMNLAGALGSKNFTGQPVIGLSHGCEITDLLHLHRLHRTLPLTARQLRPVPSLALARTLSDEMAARQGLAGVIAISPFDADSERWLGTRMVSWIPRTIEPALLVRQPVAGRFGTVGTLDHAPNLEGLEAVLCEIDRAGAGKIVIRIVGGPERLGQWLASRHAAVKYLGPLGDAALAAEAATWNGFLHPIFCLPRGCSTKLASAVAWGLPVVTTAEGRRGYQWRDGSLIETDGAEAFVAAMHALAAPEVNATAAAAVRRIVATSPTIAEVGTQIAKFLKSLPDPAADRPND